jgi:glycosyltransferase involved in cell wall biosynthesis
MIKILFFSNSPTPYQVDFWGGFDSGVEINQIYLSELSNLNSFSWKFNSIYSTLDDYSYVLGFLKIFKHIAESKYILIGGYRLKYAWLISVICTLLGKKYYFWLEKPSPKSAPAEFIRFLYQYFIMGFCSGILCIGSEAKNYYSKINKNVINFPYAINVLDYTVGNMSFKDNKLNVFFSGQLIERKGLLPLLNLFFSKKLPEEVVLSISGDGPLRNEVLEASATIGNIKYLGLLQGNDLRNEYSKNDILVLPSYYDGWAVVIAEAMSSGLAVISTNETGAFVDLVLPNNCGICCEPKESSISKSILSYFNDRSKLISHKKAAYKAMLNSMANSSNSRKTLIKFLTHEK